MPHNETPRGFTFDEREFNFQAVLSTSGVDEWPVG